MSNSGPGYKTHPEHRITVEPVKDRVKVAFDGEILADTVRAVRLREANYPPVYYVPRQDVKMERLVRTDHRTHCPFKGDASYFSLAGTRPVVNAVWSYETPFDEVMDIKERLAFYPDKVTITVEPA
ncbi:DUF427 domain-containing protein [Pendulispora albinea]|uniref:DUF427 domain-containing protein n=1 Tax=Pendulispora albinea TaxID=2741071 RepID=A0ABZ2LL15_9BACT